MPHLNQRDAVQNLSRFGTFWVQCDQSCYYWQSEETFYYRKLQCYTKQRKSNNISLFTYKIKIIQSLELEALKSKIAVKIICYDDGVHRYGDVTMTVYQ